MHALALDNIPMIKKGHDLGRMIIHALRERGVRLEKGDIVAVTEKIVAKAEGRVMSLESVHPSKRAAELASATGKDPRMVELILGEAEEVLRVGDNFIITLTKHGLICANAGIDQSNVEPGTAKLLPVDPDKSAAGIRATLEEEYKATIGVIITDSFGRPFRRGSTGVAIGCSGVKALWDRRGEKDIFGRELTVTRVAVADCLASCANLVLGEADEGTPVAVLKGLNCQGDGRASDLLRTKEEDIFR